MPKKPTYHHPLRKIRKITGLTQHKFAEALGYSRGSVQAVENGRIPISPHFAFSVMIKFGADSGELMKGEEGKALTVEEAGKKYPYTIEAYYAWLKIEYTPRQAANQFSNTACWIEVLYHAAAEKGLLLALQSRTYDWMEEMKKTFDMDNEISRVLKRQSHMKTPDGIKLGPIWWPRFARLPSPLKTK